MRRPAYEVDQAHMLDWLAQAHALAEGQPHGRFEERMSKLIHRCGCAPSQISKRGYSLPDIGCARWSENTVYDLERHPHGQDWSCRSRRYAEIVDAYLEAEYATADDGALAAPADLVHVTCTGYLSPSPAQRLVSRRGWGGSTRVTHAYHMGCYAAIPALRIAAGCVATSERSGAPRVDIVHTEVCSLHFDPTVHDLDQLVMQSLFGDGFIRYSMSPGARGPGLRLLATCEAIVPDSADAMTWVIGEWGMHMTLARDVPERLAGPLRAFVSDLYRRAGLDLGDAKRSLLAVHPGGPKIIDRVRDVLELEERQVHASREVLFEHGNMSSATLPHVWMRLAGDPGVAPGTPVLSLAFGPGLTCAGALFEKQ